MSAFFAAIEQSSVLQARRIYGDRRINGSGLRASDSKSESEGFGPCALVSKSEIGTLAQSAEVGFANGRALSDDLRNRPTSPLIFY
jgi:hypothetical protein